MFEKTVSQETRRVLEKIAGSGIADSFYLAGGTALALQLGHRISIDLDWFTADSFSLEAVKKKISVLGEFKLSGEEEWTLHGALDGVKVSFLRYDYSLLYPLIGWEGIKLADERDIAAMKIDAASSRGSKKDFIDIYYLLLKYRLPELIGFFEKKFQNIKYNKLHILKSLVFFEDAEDEPMPIMIKKTDWEAVKKKIAAEANKILEA